MARAAEVLAAIGEKLLWLDTPALSTPGSRAAKMNELRRWVDRNGMHTTALDETCLLPPRFVPGALVRSQPPNYKLGYQKIS